MRARLMLACFVALAAYVAAPSASTYVDVKDAMRIFGQHNDDHPE